MPDKITPDAAAKEWLELEADQRRIRERFAELEPILAPVIKKAREKSKIFHDWKFVWISFDKESFSLSKARLKVKEAVLAPFISQSKVAYIRTYFQGDSLKEESL